MKYSVILIILLFQIHSTFACTILSATGNNITYAASNKDWNNTDTRLKVYSPSEGKYGRIYFGYQIPEGFMNAEGVNDQGLWYSGASLPERNDVYNHYNKPSVNGELCEKALEECATVNEVIAYYQIYFSPHWQGHSMWVDRYGNSVVIEYGEKDVVFIYPDENYQVMTNFYLSDSLNQRWYNCYRFDVANYMLENTENVTQHSIGNILDNVHQEGLFPTVTSNIYNLTTGELILYYFHNYEEYITMNFYEQIAFGDQYLTLPDLYNQIEIVSPKDGEDVNSSSIFLEWRGNAEVYDVYYSQYDTFNDCVPIRYVKPALALIGINGLMILLFCISIGFNLLIKGNRSITTIVVIVTVILIASCDLGIINSPIEDSDIYHKLKIDNLENATLYFWKIEVPDDGGIISCSHVNYFFTNQPQQRRMK